MGLTSTRTVSRLGNWLAPGRRMSNRLTIGVEGIGDSSLVADIESTIRESFQEMALPGAWRVIVRPSPVSGRWDFRIHGLDVRHTMSIATPPKLTCVPATNPAPERVRLKAPTGTMPGVTVLIAKVVCGGGGVGGGGAVEPIFAVAVPITLVSAILTACTVALAGLGRVAGGEYTPVCEIDPNIPPPPTTPLIAHLTPMFMVPITVAVYWRVVPM